MRKLLLAGMTLLILSCATFLPSNTTLTTPTAAQVALLPSVTQPATQTPGSTETLTPSPTPDAPPTLAISNYLKVTPDFNWEVDSLSRITGISISPNKERIAVFTLRPPEQWWLEMRDTETGTLFWDVNVGIAKYNALAFSPDTSMIATGTADGLVRIWDTESGELIRTYEGHTSAARFVVFSPDATMIASGGSDSTARVWEVSTGARLGVYQIKTNARDIAFSPDSRYLAVTTNYINVYEILSEDGEPIVYIDSEGDTKDMGEVAFSPDGNVLVGAGTWHNNQINRWQYRLLVWGFPDNSRQPHNIAIEDAIEDVVIAPDNKVMICLYKDKGRMLLINIEDGKIRGDINIGSKLFLSYSPDISTFAVVSTKTKVTIWNVPKQ
jgi:WD40 repeat protein